MRADPSVIPPEIQQGLPGIMKEYFVDLLSKMVAKRKEMAKAEEDDIKYIEKKLRGTEADDDKDEEDNGEFKDEAEIEGGDGEFSDEDSDSEDGDFELEGGDMQLYDSALGDLDELEYAKQTIEGLKA